jgi:PAS domain S-box-containing protein
MNLSIKALDEHYATIVNNAHDIVLLFDEFRRIVDFNQAALFAYGYSGDELNRMTANDLRVP